MTVSEFRRAYGSNENGPFEVFVVPFPDLDGRWQVSNEGGRLPEWSPDGSVLYYQDTPRIMAVDIGGDGDSLRASPPRLVVEGSYTSLAPTTNYSMHPDGDRFVVKVEEGAIPQFPPTLVLNWFEEVRRIVER